MSLNLSTQIHYDSQLSVTLPTTLRSRSTHARNVPVVAGLCVPKGRLSDATEGHVSGSGHDIAAQFTVLNRWNDGSVRWMLTSFLAPEVSGNSQELRIVATTAKHSSPHTAADFLTTVKLIEDEICISTRNLTSDPPTQQNVRLNPSVCDIDGNELPIRIESIREEIAGPVRQVYVIEACIQAMPYVVLQIRLEHWTSAGLMHVETRIRNARRANHVGGLWDLGDSGSFVFGSLAIAVTSDEIPAGATTFLKAERNHEVCGTASEVFLRQFSSGGPYWNSPCHVNASGQVDVPAHGYVVNTNTQTTHGLRAEPTILVEGDSAFLTVAVPDFWQQFPGSIAAAMGALEIGLFPAIPSVTHELQGGEQKKQSFWLATGSGKGNVNDLDWVHDAPRLLQTTASIVDADVLPWFCETDGCAPRFSEYLRDATSGNFGLAARRESIDEYGWRNFGEIPADHEQTHFAGSNKIVSHYNNQFDMIFGSFLQLAATGDLKWFDLLDPLARHVMDIDIYHTSEDRAAFNGGLFWHTDHYVDAHSSTHRTYSRHNQKPGQPYGGGPSCEHNYTTGLLHYHYLTGSPEARESVLLLADWVIQMDDGRNTVFGLLDDEPTGAASATVLEDFHGPGRGAGNSINALLDAWTLTNSGCYLTKLEELIRRCVHPDQNLDDLRLLDAEGHWSYTVFLNSLGRYLLAKRDADQFDAMYSYGRDVMQTYGRWMAVHERRTLDRPQELQYPTEAWAAQDFRKANVLRIAATCEDNAAYAAAMHAKADEINEAAWNDLEAFGNTRLTARCLSILMTEGHREVFHLTCEPTLIPACRAKYDFGSWSMFVPQKQRIRNLMKSPTRLIVAASKAMQPGRLMRAWRALRKQMQ